MILAETPRRQRVTKLSRWGHWFTFFNILIALTISSLYVFSSPAPSTAIGVAYLFSNWIGHIAFLTFIGFVILILPLCYLVSNVKVVKAAAALVAAVGLALLAFDALLYVKHGVHVSFSSAELVKSETRIMMDTLGWQQWGMLVLLFVVWLSFQLLLANALWKRIERFMLHRYAQPIGLFFIACFFIGHATHIWADANLYQPIVKQDDMFPLSYPATAKTLMAKYGMLDLANYEQRKALQLDRKVHQVNYPLKPVYCSVTPGVKAMFLWVESDNADELAVEFNLQSLGIFVNNPNPQSAWFSAQYGLPALYEGVVTVPPLIADIARNFNVPFMTIESAEFLGDSFWQENLAGIVIAKVPLKRARELLSHAGDTAIMMASAHNPAGNWYSNVISNGVSTLATAEDIAPTLLGLMGCSANIADYSTGQNLFAPSRNWTVTTAGDKVILLTEHERVEVDVLGNYKIFDLTYGTENSSELNTSLLSRAVKHVSRFIQN